MHFAVGAECQLGADVIDNLGSGRCRKGQYGSIGQQFAHLGNLEIRGAKIVSPLGDAVSFVNGDKGNVHMSKFLLKEFRAKAFGRNIQKLIGVENSVIQHLEYFIVGKTRIDGGGRYASPA